MLVFPVLAIVLAYLGFPVHELLGFLNGSLFGGLDVTLLFIAGFFVLKKTWNEVGTATMFVGFVVLVYALA